jgi:hypothetical protein
MDDKVLRRSLGRRRFLRRAAGITAGVAGASAVSAAVATPAQASAGANMIVGSPNDAGTAATSLTTNSSTNAALVLGNTATLTDANNVPVGGPALQFTPAGEYTVGPVGSMGMSTDGEVWIRKNGDSAPFSDPIRTFSNSTFSTGFSPVRMLDTRPGQPAVNRILNPGVLDSAGNIKAGQILQVSLDDLFVFADSAYVNVTLLAGSVGAYITLFPSDQPLPLASNINFSPGQLVNNFALVGLGTLTDNSNQVIANNALSIFAGQPCRIIIDVLGAIVFSFAHIKSISGVTGLRAPGAGRKPPAGLF